jgi:arylsulfatase A-like enzyme
MVADACAEWVRAESMRRPPLVRAATLLAVLAACGRTDYRGANVVIIGIDTLRADHVGAYGYPRPTTPRLDAFAREATLFETAVSQSSWTLPAFASMFTGLLPAYHRAGEGRFPAVSYLAPSFETLATVLQRAGYRTGTFVSNVWAGAEVGMARGYDQHGEFILSEHAVDAGIAWLQAHRTERFLLFVHVMAPHQPYMPSPEDAAPFIDPSYTGRIGLYAGGNPQNLTDADRRRIVDLYDGDVRYADRLVGRVFDAIDELGVDRHTIVVVVSDHGEELYDHAGIGHGHTLYDEVLLVPLLIRFPDSGWHGRVDRPVRTMDLFPTLLEALGMPVPTDINGVSLMPLVRGDAAVPGSEVALSEYVCFGDEIKSLRTPIEKLILSPTTGNARLFDLRADPHERHDVAAQRPDVTAALRDWVERELVASHDGFHLLGRSGRRPNVLRARLHAVTAFTNVALSSPEPGDAFRLSPDRRVLDVKLHLREAKFPDVDGIAFRTEGDRPFIVRRLQIDGRLPPWGQVLLGNEKVPPRVQLPWYLGPETRNVTVQYPEPPPGALDGEPRVRISFVQRGAPPTTTVRPETLERLRAMGYMP